jgi:hypothetical protein
VLIETKKRRVTLWSTFEVQVSLLSRGLSRIFVVFSFVCDEILFCLFHVSVEGHLAFVKCCILYRAPFFFIARSPFFFHCSIRNDREHSINPRGRGHRFTCYQKAKKSCAVVGSVDIVNFWFTILQFYVSVLSCCIDCVLCGEALFSERHRPWGPLLFFFLFKSIGFAPREKGLKMWLKTSCLDNKIRHLNHSNVRSPVHSFALKLRLSRGQFLKFVIPKCWKDICCQSFDSFYFRL